jgi:hypothetical protein
MEIYNYHPKTKEFLGTEIPREDPLESKIQERPIYLLPANATFIECPKSQKNFAWCFNEEKNNWFRVPDFRGTKIYSIYDGSESVVSELGSLPSGYTTDCPEVDFPAWDGKKWVKDSIAEAASIEAEKEREIKAIDASMPSVGELIQLLIEKKVLTPEDFPTSVQGVIEQRKAKIKDKK